MALTLLETLMRRLFNCLLTAILLTSAASQIQAERAFYSTQQHLIYVAPSKFENETEQLALCHLVETGSILFFNIWRSALTYALSNNDCNSSSYRELSIADLKTAQALGLISDSIPTKPRLTLKSRAEGFWGVAAIALWLAYEGLKWRRAQKAKGRKKAFTEGVTPATEALVDVMCHAAKADGYFYPGQSQVIKQAVKELTGESVALEDVKRVATLAEDLFHPEGDKSLIQGHMKDLIEERTNDEQLIMMRGALTVVAVNGKLFFDEAEFIYALAEAMDMSNETVQRLLAAVSSGSGA